MKIRFTLRQAYLEFENGKIPLTRLFHYGFMQSFINKLFIKVFGEDFYSLPVKKQLEKIYEFVYGDRENWSKDIEVNFNMVSSYIEMAAAEGEQKKLSVDEYVPRDFISKQSGGIKKKKNGLNSLVAERKEENTAEFVSSAVEIKDAETKTETKNSIGETKDEKKFKDKKLPVEKMFNDIDRVLDF